MQADFYQRFVSAIMPQRLNAFRDQGLDDLDVSARYVWNLCLCEALYPILQNFEVGLRNQLHNALHYRTGQADWYDSKKLVLGPKEQSSVAEAKKKLQDAGKQVQPDRLVAELSFGFWTSLFSHKYEQPATRLWPQLMPRVFPNRPAAIYQRKHVAGLIENARKLRNRIFHHERILHWNLPDAHQSILNMIRWMNPSLLYMTKCIDRFDTVYTSGWPRCRLALTCFETSVDYHI